MKIIIPAAVLVLALVLFLPIPQSAYDDGGTREYAALTYKIVKWHKLVSGMPDENGIVDSVAIYDKTSVYWFPDNFKSIDELFEIESKTE